MVPPSETKNIRPLKIESHCESEQGASLYLLLVGDMQRISSATLMSEFLLQRWVTEMVQDGICTRIQDLGATTGFKVMILFRLWLFLDVSWNSLAHASVTVASHFYTGLGS